MKIQTAAIVLAGGSGRRMNSDTKKQYLKIQGKPMLYYSLAAFEKSDVEKIIIVVSPGDEQYCLEQIVRRYHFKKIDKIVAGGRERYHSVYHGLQAVENAEYVLIHDAARPFLTQDVIAQTLECVRRYKACVVAVPSKDTIKIGDENGFIQSTPPRRFVWNIQTPQAFSFALVWEAYQKFFKMEETKRERLSITDDAMIVEHITGKPIKLLEGSYANIKITTPEDLRGMEAYSFE